MHVESFMLAVLQAGLGGALFDDSAAQNVALVAASLFGKGSNRCRHYAHF
jgi:hypothetical protein